MYKLMPLVQLNPFQCDNGNLSDRHLIFRSDRCSSYTIARDFFAIASTGPGLGFDRVDATDVHCVNFLERAVLGFNKEEKHNQGEGTAADCKNKADRKSVV